jgi:hypothetical protein
MALGIAGVRDIRRHPSYPSSVISRVIWINLHPFPEPSRSRVQELYANDIRSFHLNIQIDRRPELLHKFHNHKHMDLDVLYFHTFIYIEDGF